MKIDLKKAFFLLQECAAVTLDDNVLVYPSLSEIEGDENSEFMFLKWEDEGQEFNVKFLEGANQEVEVIGCSMFLFDTNGELNQITLLVPQKLD